MNDATLENISNSRFHYQAHTWIRYVFPSQGQGEKYTTNTLVNNTLICLRSCFDFPFFFEIVVVVVVIVC